MDDEPKLRAGHRIPQAVFDNALSYFHRTERCVYLGELSAEIGWSVERTEQVVDALVASGSVRPATDEEKMAIDAPQDANLFALAVERSLLSGFKN